MKKIIPFLAALSLLAPMGAAAANGVGNVEASDLNVRSAPSMDAAVLGRLNTGQKVNIITKTGGAWFKIEFGNAVGYVYAPYINDHRNGSASTSSAPTGTTDTPSPSPEASTKGQLVVDTAKQYLGIPYVYGGSSPSGFDCSGLVQYVFKQLGVSINRVAADQTAHGVPVTKAELMPGDVVFFHNTAKYSTINHVGIYVGDGNFIHAPQTGDVVKITTLDSGYYARTFVAARRILY